MRFPRKRSTQRAGDEFLIKRREFRPAAREKTRDHRKSVRDRRRSRRLQPKRLRCPGDAVVALGRRTFTADRPELVAQMLLYEGYRSEERRVGKECRSRWVPGHEKRKGTSTESSRR